MSLKISELFNILDTIIRQNLTGRTAPLVEARYDVACIMRAESVSFIEGLRDNLNLSDKEINSFELSGSDIAGIVSNTNTIISRRPDNDNLLYNALNALVDLLNEEADSAES